MTFLLFASLSDSLRVLRQMRSSCRLIPLSHRRFEVNQGLEVRGFTVTVFRGAYLSSINDMLELKWSCNKRVEVKIVYIEISIGYILIKISKINCINWATKKCYFIDSWFCKININTQFYDRRYICIKHIWANN